MLKYLIGLALTANLYSASHVVSVEANVRELKSMTDKQKRTLFASYKYGFNKDLGLSMALIGWMESKSGKYKVNLSDPSFGTYHNLLSSVLSRAGVKNSAYYRNKYANLLMQNEEFARSQALAELLFWESYHLQRTGRQGLWQKTICSYNAGTGWAGEEAKSYFANIKNKLLAVRKIHFFESLKKSLTAMSLNYK